MSLMRGTYIGEINLLKGKKAELQSDPDRPGGVLAQFDDVTTGFGYGWTPFRIDEFELHRWSDLRWP